MAGVKIDPIDLETCLWRELRTEVSGWEDETSDGFDCLTRYWCQNAVFEVYWVAQRRLQTNDNAQQCAYDLFLTEDLQLESFKCEFSYQPDIKWRQQLANKLGWHERAAEIIQELAETQPEQFRE